MSQEVAMTTLTHATDSAPPATRQHLVIDAALAILFWAMAAAFVAMAHSTFAPISPAATFAAQSCVILLAAWGYMRCAGRKANITHALLVGEGWLLRDI